VGKGPNNEPDHGDARYWVKEVLPTQEEFSPGGDPLRFFNDELPADYPLQWLTATNLAEWRPEISEQAHGLDTDGSAVVRVRRHPYTPDGVPRFYFDRGGGGGGGTQWGRFLIQGHNGDWLDCVDTDPQGTRQEVMVAKPWELRWNPWSYDLDDTRRHEIQNLWTNYTVTYHYLGSVNRRYARVGNPEDPTIEEEQWIVRPYMIGDLIEAVKVGQAVTGVLGADWLDTNTNARRWMESPVA
jgi:hypothetical protein